MLIIRPPWAPHGRIRISGLDGAETRLESAYRIGSLVFTEVGFSFLRKLGVVAKWSKMIQTSAACESFKITRNVAIHGLKCRLES